MPAGSPRSPEAERLASLRSYQVLGSGSGPGSGPGSGSDAALDALTAAAARALGVPSAVVSLLEQDRLWFKSTVGLSALIGYEASSIPREASFSAHLLTPRSLSRGALVVSDASIDSRFADLPWVSGPEHLRAFAGVPVIGRDGLALGVLCVLDRHPRPFDATGVQVLVGLARAAAELLELRRVDAGAGLVGRDVLGESHRLRAGIDAGELVVHYQPVVDLVSTRWVGVEALVRWDHPERGLLAPAAFLPLAETSGLIVPLGRQVLIQACTQVARWRAQIPAAARLHVAVNLSGRQLGEPDVVDVIAQVLQLSGLPAHALVLELTETSLAGTGVEVDTALQRIRALGVRLALDDFGTGYASVSYLQRFQPDIVKIDRCFVAALGRSERDDLLARTLIELGQGLGCDIVAEGVEDVEQAQTLIALGVRTAQGFLFSTARSAVQLRRRLHIAGHGSGDGAAG